MNILRADKMLGLAEDRDSANGLATEISSTMEKYATAQNGALQAATRLRLLLNKEAGSRMVVVANLAGEDGATQLTAKLGRALALLDEAPVLVVDGNFRTPGLHSAFGVPNELGLANLIEETGLLDEAIHIGKAGVPSVLTIGATKKSFVSLLSSPQCSSVLHLLRQEFRYILISVGALLDCPESMLLAAASDGVVAALAAGIRRRHEVLRFRQQLELLQVRLFGIVLTQGVADK